MNGLRSIPSRLWTKNMCQMISIVMSTSTKHKVMASNWRWTRSETIRFASISKCYLLSELNKLSSICRYQLLCYPTSYKWVVEGGVEKLGRLQSSLEDGHWWLYRSNRMPMIVTKRSEVWESWFQVSTQGLKPSIGSRNWDEEQKKMPKVFHWMDAWSDLGPVTTNIIILNTLFIVSLSSDSHDRCIAYGFSNHAAWKGKYGSRLSFFRLFRANFKQRRGDLVETCLGLSVLLYHRLLSLFKYSIGMGFGSCFLLSSFMAEGPWSSTYIGLFEDTRRSVWIVSSLLS